ncbi:hypothetical protein C8R44DRAFT_877741 [Mycena epipterygia]|nr:hypothetical protein C8R44DRAFT_877741 [Mycena epipterygia]
MASMSFCTHGDEKAQFPARTRRAIHWARAKTSIDALDYYYSYSPVAQRLLCSPRCHPEMRRESFSFVPRQLLPSTSRPILTSQTPFCRAGSSLAGRSTGRDNPLFAPRPLQHAVVTPRPRFCVPAEAHPHATICHGHPATRRAAPNAVMRVSYDILS